MNDREGRSLLPLINSGNHTSPATSGYSTMTRVKERAKRCFTSKYHMRRVKNNGAILIIVWSFFISAMYNYIGYNVLRIVHGSYILAAMLATAVLATPFAGCLADIRFGRYKVIRFSMLTMWMSSILLTAIMVVVKSLNLHNFSRIILLPFLSLLELGYVGFQANIIQFGVDQRYDASSNEIKTFVIWYSWACISSTGLVGTATFFISDEYKLLASLLVCFNLTIAVSSEILFNNVLIKEPVTPNPFKMVYEVIKYALKHKSPRQRSAFTYCEDQLPSRIDFAKIKYGGPFTTEQVEDVKTLFKVTMIAFVICAFYGMTTGGRSISTSLRSIILNALSHSPRYIFSNLYAIIGTVLVPFHEIIVYPLFHSCLQDLRSYVKLLAGITLRFARHVLFLALITYARGKHYALEDHVMQSSNTTLSCIFFTPHDGSDFLRDTLDYGWTVLIEIVTVTSDLLILIGVLEFYCAQVPFSMKGIVAGIYYAFICFFLMLSQMVKIPFGKRSLEWGTGILSCGFWYLLTILIYLVVVTITLVAAMGWYKKRKREDVLPNEQIFAERYYSRN